MDAHQPPIHPIVPPPAIYDHAYNGKLTVRQGTPVLAVAVLAVMLTSAAVWIALR